MIDSKISTFLLQSVDMLMGKGTETPHLPGMVATVPMLTLLTVLARLLRQRQHAACRSARAGTRLVVETAHAAAACGRERAGPPRRVRDARSQRRSHLPHVIAADADDASSATTTASATTVFLLLLFSTAIVVVE